jgi:hypothetical protein
MNKEDILLLCDYLKEQELDKGMDKLRNKIYLIKKQIEAQDIIADVQKELAEMDKEKK